MIFKISSKKKKKTVSNKLEKYINNDCYYDISIQLISNTMNNYMQTFTTITKNDNEEEIFHISFMEINIFFFELLQNFLK